MSPGEAPRPRPANPLPPVPPPAPARLSSPTGPLRPDVTLATSGPPKVEGS